MLKKSKYIFFVNYLVALLAIFIFWINQVANLVNKTTPIALPTLAPIITSKLSELFCLYVSAKIRFRLIFINYVEIFLFPISFVHNSSCKVSFKPHVCNVPPMIAAELLYLNSVMTSLIRLCNCSTF